MHHDWIHRPTRWMVWTLVIFLGSLTSVSHLPVATAASLPSSPQYVEAMAGPAQVAVTWDLPSSNGGEVSLKYTVRVWTMPPPTSSPIFASCSTTNLGCVVTGLLSGSTYYVDVVASNSAGPGAPSAAKPISPGGAGSAPSNVSAAMDSKGLITVRWTPLASFSGAAFAWYKAEVFTSSEISIGSYSGFCEETSIGASSCVIGGLKSGVTYYAQVRTVSSLGSSYPSTPRYQVVAPSSSTTTSTPSQSPSSATVKLTAPQQVKVLALSKSVRVSWKAPTVTGGKVILSYSASAFTAKGVVISACKTTAKIFSCTISRLKPKQKTFIGVIAVYSGASSPMSKLIAIVPKS